MSALITESRGDPHEVVIAGGGVAALEAVLALHDAARERVRVTLIAPNDQYVHRPMAVAEPFGLATAQAVGVRDFAWQHGAIHLRDTVEALDADNAEVVTGSGRRVAYDSLLLAIGARAVDALPGALTFGGPDSSPAFAALLDELDDGTVGSVAFVVPPGVAWTLPIYELALMTAAHLGSLRRDVVLTLATPEHAPLAVFGRRPADTVARLLRESGVELVLRTGEAPAADRVVALPRLVPPEIPGVPHSAKGFVPVGRHCQVDDLDGVYAAGDLTWHPVKQGGIAAQQADAAAQAIAARAGADLIPRPFRPVLRGVLLTGGAPHYIRDGEVGREPLWSPPGKIAGRYLSSYLDRLAGERLHDMHAGDSSEPAATTLALEAADADARWGDLSSALRWLDVAEQLAVVLPDEYARKRAVWEDRLAGVTP